MIESNSLFTLLYTIIVVLGNILSRVVIYKYTYLQSEIDNRIIIIMLESKKG